MPIEVVSSRNLNQPSQNSKNSQSQQNPQTLQSFKNMDFGDYSAWVLPEVPERASNKLKLGVFCTTLAGVATALAGVMKFRKIPFNGAELLKGNFKKCGLWNIDYKEKEILAVAAGSILGGLTGGMIFDKKENRNAKLRESIIQFIGNVSIPIGCVSGSLHLFEKIKPDINKQTSKVHIENHIHNETLKTGAKEIKKSGPKAIITALGLVVGIFLGNKVGNLINEKMFHVKDNRKLKPADMSPHVDDVCFALSMAGDGKGFIQYVSRIIPAALMISGYSAGITKERPDRIKHEHTSHNCNNA